MLLALLLAPSAAAVPASLDARLQPPLVMDGDVLVRTDAGVLDVAGAQSLAVRARHLNITLVRIEPRQPHSEAEKERGLPLVGDVLGQARTRPEDPEVVYLEMHEPELLSVSSRAAGARELLAVGPFDAGEIQLASALLRLDTAGVARLRVPAEMAPEDPQPWLRAEGAGALNARGTLRGLFEGVSLVVQNRTSALPLDAVRGEHGAWIAVLRWTGASLDHVAEQPLALSAPHLDLQLDGTLRGARAWGSVVHRSQQDLRGASVVAQGALRGALEPSGPSVALRAAGDVAYLAVGQERQQLAEAAAAGAGIAILGALAYYAQHLRFLAVPLYARVAPSELLDNDVRRRVHAHLQAQPGSDVKDTAAAVGVSWSTAAYHLHRLEREGLLLSRRAGRSKRFFLNGVQGTARAEAIGALRNPTSMAIAQLVARQPGLMQKEIGAELHLPASTVSWHMRRLRQLGVVREERRWRRAEYAPGHLWQELSGLVAPARA
jgi:predicted transcriptional regulator